MFFRFNRSEAAREAYRLYDDYQTKKVIAYCTRQLSRPGADPELRIIRAMNYMDLDRPLAAIADWQACLADPHVAAVAHYDLGNHLANGGLENEPAAWDHFERAVALGWAEGHVGKGLLLLGRGCRLRDEQRPDAAAACFYEAVAELTAGLTSPAKQTRNRAYGLRASAYYNLGDLAACGQDSQRSEVVTEEEQVATDPRATGAELFASPA